jgi:hypothetical protein
MPKLCLGFLQTPLGLREPCGLSFDKGKGKGE